MIGLAYRFCRAYRLLKTDEYSSVFDFHCVRNNAYFQVYARPNTLGHPRLGLVVGKKVAKRASHRNYIKRTVREWFRMSQYQLGSVDYVVRPKRMFDYESRITAVLALASLFTKLGQCRASLSP